MPPPRGSDARRGAVTVTVSRLDPRASPVEPAESEQSTVCGLPGKDGHQTRQRRMPLSEAPSFDELRHHLRLQL